jgi:hypothetical protein
MRWVHASAVHGLHLQWRVAMESIILLDWRLVMWVVSGIVVPSSTVVVKMILVMVLVVHLQLAHVDVGTGQFDFVYPCKYGSECPVQILSKANSLSSICAMVLLYLGGVGGGDLRTGAHMHA